jgi:hypothetical protein
MVRAWYYIVRTSTAATSVSYSPVEAICETDCRAAALDNPDALVGDLRDFTLRTASAID